MEVLDEDGNLFGVVNVIDLLVLLFVLGAVVAGAALVFSGDDSESPTIDTTYVTLDLGQQPTYISSEITAGDSYIARGNSQLTLTDVYVTPQGDQTRVIVRAELQAPGGDGGLMYANAPPRLGRTLDIATDRYQVRGQIRAVGENGSLSRGSTTVVLTDTMTAADAREIAPGDEIRVAGKSVAVIEDVAAYGTGEPAERRVFVEATLQTHRQQGEHYFGGSQVRRGQTITLAGGSYTLEGRLERVGGGLERDSTDVVIEGVVPSETALKMSEGDVATVAGQDTAQVAHVTTYATQNPDQKRVYVGVSLQTLAYNGLEHFGEVRVQRGADVTLDTGQYTLSGLIERVGTLEPRGSVRTRTVVLQMSEVQQEMTDAIHPELTERSNGVTIARITDVTVEPSLLITTGEDGSVNVVDHPINREVTIRTELRVRETTSGVQFKGQSLRQGSTVVIDLGTVIIEASVVSIGG